MKKPSFENMKLALDEACDLLRAFTLGRHGVTPKHGITGIRRVTDRCNQMERLFADGPDAKASKVIVASARSRVLAAKTRLALLRQNQ